MKYILEFNKYNKYLVVKYNDNLEDPSAVSFDVVIKTPNGDEISIDINYQIFLEFVQEISPNLTSYINNHKELNNFEKIFFDLQELGFNFKEYLQKWVDVNITPDNLKNMIDDDNDEDVDDSL